MTDEQLEELARLDKAYLQKYVNGAAGKERGKRIKENIARSGLNTATPEEIEEYLFHNNARNAFRRAKRARENAKNPKKPKDPEYTPEQIEVLRQKHEAFLKEFSVKGKLKPKETVPPEDIGRYEQLHESSKSYQRWRARKRRANSDEYSCEELDYWTTIVPDTGPIARNSRIQQLDKKQIG